MAVLAVTPFPWDSSDSQGVYHLDSTRTALEVLFDIKGLDGVLVAPSVSLVGQESYQLGERVDVRDDRLIIELGREVEAIPPGLYTLTIETGSELVKVDYVLFAAKGDVNHDGAYDNLDLVDMLADGSYQEDEVPWSRLDVVADEVFDALDMVSMQQEMPFGTTYADLVDLPKDTWVPHVFTCRLRAEEAPWSEGTIVLEYECQEPGGCEETFATVEQCEAFREGLDQPITIDCDDKADFVLVFLGGGLRYLHFARWRESSR